MFSMWFFVTSIHDLTTDCTNLAGSLASGYLYTAAGYYGIFGTTLGKETRLF